MNGEKRRKTGWAALIVLGMLSLAALPAMAEEATAVKPQGTKADAEKPAAGSPTAGLGQRSDRDVGPGDELSFRQEQVAEQMRELEQRMFRLSETLKTLEPENSSRFMLGLKYAREELILHRMDELKKALAELALTGATDEQRLVLTRLERLQQLLLSSDLDFEMKLERLRAIRETMRKLNAVVKEEVREEKISKAAAEKEKELAELAKRRAALEALIKRQTEHLENNAPLAKQESPDDKAREEIAQLASAQQATQKETQSLAASPLPGAASKHLPAAAQSMQSAADALGKNAPGDATAPMEKALDELKKELEQLGKKEAEAKAALAREKFDAMRADQQANHRATDEVTQMTRALGSNGAATVPELVRAAAAMGGAESAFAASQAGAGNGEQGKALEALKYAEQLLAEEAERLARQLRNEVKKRVTEGLTLMLEEQIIVRKQTVALQSGVKEGSRQALTAVAALAKREERITSVAQEMINIVEETEFGIALPAALAAVRDATEGVQMSLAEGDASDSVVAAEQRIEADLKSMLEIVSEMSDANSRNRRRGNGGNSAEDRRKEQNRIISELRMLRLLQDRVRQNTVEVDAKRAGASLTAAIRKRVEYLEGRQDDIRDAAERLAEERGEEIPLPE
jgi:hypothetical protein